MGAGASGYNKNFYTKPLGGSVQGARPGNARRLQATTVATAEIEQGTHSQQHPYLGFVQEENGFLSNGLLYYQPTRPETTRSTRKDKRIEDNKTSSDDETGDPEKSEEKELKKRILDLESKVRDLTSHNLGRMPRTRPLSSHSGRGLPPLPPGIVTKPPNAIIKYHTLLTDNHMTLCNPILRPILPPQIQNGRQISETARKIQTWLKDGGEGPPPFMTPGPGGPQFVIAPNHAVLMGSQMMPLAPPGGRRSTRHSHRPFTVQTNLPETQMHNELIGFMPLSDLKSLSSDSNLSRVKRNAPQHRASVHSKSSARKERRIKSTSSKPSTTNETKATVESSGSVVERPPTYDESEVKK